MGGWLFSNAHSIERLGVLRYRGRRRAVDMRKDRVEDERGLVGEVLDVLLEIAVEDREEAQVVVLEGHPMGEMQRPDRIRRFLALVLEWTSRPASRQSPAGVT